MNQGCKKEQDKAQEPVIQNPVAKIDLSGITTTDYAGNILSPVDPTDWTNDSAWTAAETAIFQLPDTTQLANTERASLSFSPAYPNPLQVQFALHIEADKRTLLQLVICDSMLTVKDRYFMPLKSGSNDFAFRLEPVNYNAGTNYRLYYGFYGAAESLYYKGHGDLKIK